MSALKTRKTVPLSAALLLIIIIAVVAGIVIYVQYDQKRKYIASTERSNAAQESYITSVFERIESNLALIREKESMINKDFTTPENFGELSPEERIQHEIEYIQSLMDENNNMISSLNQQINEKDSRLKNYELSVNDLKSRITKYKDDLDNLLAEKEALKFNLDEANKAKAMLSSQVDTLNSDLEQKSNELTDQKLLVISKENDLNTAYYAVGSFKVLKDNNILQKEGGFLGINRTTTLTGNPDAGLFHEIDIRDVTKIPVFSKRWEIVSGQDPASYELTYDNNEMEWIQITDPEKFWKKTKYLVIVVREKDESELALSR
jgi:hypothetical protein